MKINRSFMLPVLMLALILAFSGCEKKSVQTNISSPEQPNVKRVKGRGKVTKINHELGSVELDHEEIKGVMPAMIMEFYVSDKSELEKLKVGDKAEFVLEEDRGQEKLTSIKKIQ